MTGLPISILANDLINIGYLKYFFCLDNLVIQVWCTNYTEDQQKIKFNLKIELYFKANHQMRSKTYRIFLLDFKT